MSPVRLCLVPTCPHPAQYRGRCRVHGREQDRATHKRAGLYASRRWRLERKRQLTREPYCQHRECSRPATEVDHILPIEDGGDTWDPANLQSLCKPHHSAKTSREVRARY